MWPSPLAIFCAGAPRISHTKRLSPAFAGAFGSSSSSFLSAVVSGGAMDGAGADSPGATALSPPLDALASGGFGSSSGFLLLNVRSSAPDASRKVSVSLPSAASGST